jgi:hypothetical protein
METHPVGTTPTSVANSTCTCVPLPVINHGFDVLFIDRGRTVGTLADHPPPIVRLRPWSAYYNDP